MTSPRLAALALGWRDRDHDGRHDRWEDDRGRDHDDDDDNDDDDYEEY